MAVVSNNTDDEKPPPPLKQQTSVEDKEVEDTMHYRNPASSSHEKPTYLFGEAPKKWSSEDSAAGGKRKIEELIQRNEARRTTAAGENVTILTIEPPPSDRPGFLPVKKTHQNSPPPVTPILSPPPAFQDTKNRHLNVNESRKQGMVFSRSFEYDSRNKPLVAAVTSTGSKSFDYDFQGGGGGGPQVAPNIRSLRRERSPNFSMLTGISPSYLTKRPAPPTADKSPIFPKTIPGNSVTNYSKLAQSSNGVQILGQYKSLDVDAGRSRRSQFTRAQTTTGGNYSFRNFASDNSADAATTTASQRLNSCDSGARSDISNDDLEDGSDDDASSSLALSYKSTNSYLASIEHSTVKKQRSLTPEKKYNEAVTLTKQRSLTPDKRTLTPEHRLTKQRPRSKNDVNSSQSSLLSSRLSSGSRGSTLDRQRGRYEDARNPSSRSSSSSSSYSGGEETSIYRRGGSRGSGDYRIRRSR